MAPRLEPGKKLAAPNQSPASVKSLTRMLTIADAMAPNTGLTSPFLAVDEHDCKKRAESGVGRHENTQ